MQPARARSRSSVSPVGASISIDTFIALCLHPAPQIEAVIEALDRAHRERLTLCREEGKVIDRMEEFLCAVRSVCVYI